jgi:dephospho-CoA kinase
MTDYKIEETLDLTRDINIVYGMPTSGKTTIAKHLQSKYKFTLLDFKELTEKVKKTKVDPENPDAEPEINFQDLVQGLKNYLNETPLNTRIVIDNFFIPTEETFLETKNTLTAQITGLLAGRIAETLVFGEMSTGAHNDFQRATAIARAMVTEYGMSDLGPIQYERPTGSVFLGRDYMNDKNFSDQVALEIDEAVRKIINDCYKLGEDTLKENRSLLDLIAMHLVEIETLTKEDIDELVNSGRLDWWERKKAKMEAAKLEAENVLNQNDDPFKTEHNPLDDLNNRNE